MEVWIGFESRSVELRMDQPCLLSSALLIACIMAASPNTKDLGSRIGSPLARRRG
jgi:hypothetical protein